MEVLDIDCDDSRAKSRNSSRRCLPSLVGNGRLISLSKYTPAICLLEASIIILFIVYLFYLKPPSPEYQRDSVGTHPGDYRAFSNELNSTGSLVDRVVGCDQRSHDLKFGEICYSKDVTACPKLFDPGDKGNERSAGTLTVITTSKSGLRFKSEKRKLETVSCSTPVGGVDSCRFKTQLRLYKGEPVQQTILGWGGALTDSSINNILSLTTNGTKQLLDDYFGPDGLMFNMVRITIGGSDFSSRFYTNDDSTSDDFALNKFELTEEDVLYKIPMLRQIQDEYPRLTGRELKVFGSMWSPPTWMKTNAHYNKGYLKGSAGATRQNPAAKPDKRYFKALAKLKKLFVQEYQARSVRFWGLTIMNEPIFAKQPFLDFNTMIFPQDDYATYVSEHLGPTFRQEVSLKHIKLIAHDDNRRYLMNFTDPVLENPKVLQYIDGVSTHGYTDENYELMDEIYSKYKSSNLFLLPTELCSGHLPFMEKALIGNWHRGVHYALDIIHSLQHRAAGWVDWNMVLDVTGGPGWLGGRLDSAVIVDKAKDAFYRSPMFYVLGHFSRYIPPSSVKLFTRTINANFDYHFETVTFKLPNEDFVTVVLNNNPYEVELNIRIIEQIPSASPSYDVYPVVCQANSITTIIHPSK